MGVYEKTPTQSSYDSVARFAGHVQLKGLMPRSVEAYLAVVRIMAQWAGEDPAALGEERVREFFLHLVRVRGYAPKSMRQARAALVAFYRDMLGRAQWRVFDEVKTKDREQLPVVLSREEVRRILSEVKEPRFAVPLRLIYLCGLRLSEALHVEVRDIHRAEQRLHIREGKGGKDRCVPLPRAALDALEEWWRWHWPAYGEKFGARIPPAHRRAAQAIVRCRTAEAGMCTAAAATAGAWTPRTFPAATARAMPAAITSPWSGKRGRQRDCCPFPATWSPLLCRPSSVSSSARISGCVMNFASAKAPAPSPISPPIPGTSAVPSA